MYSQYSDDKIFSTKHYNVYKNKQLINNFGDFKLLKSKIIKLKDPILNYSFTPKIFCSSGICIEKKLAAKNPFPENINYRSVVAGNVSAEESATPDSNEQIAKLLDDQDLLAQIL